jgi:hypothetical protein
MSFSFEKPAQEEENIIEEKEGGMEKERVSKGAKAMVAVLGAAAWLEWKYLNSHDPLPLPGGELSEKDQKKVEKQGWLRTAFEKAQGIYGAMGKVEDFYTDKDWDKILKNPEERKETAV